MPTISVPTNLRNAFITLYNQFENTRGQAATDLNDLVMRVPSNDTFNTYGWLGAFPNMREWVGPRAVQGLKARVYTVYNKKYEITIGVDADTFDDQKLVETGMIVQGMAQAAINLQRDLIIELLVNGHTRNAYDGQYYFDTDHPVDIDVAGLGTQSNYEAAGFALNATNFGIARSRMRAFRGENGRPFGVANAGGLALVVPQALETAAQSIVGTAFLAQGGVLQTNTLQNAARMIVVPELDAYSTTAWYLFDTNGLPKPFLLQERQAPRFQTKTAPTEENMFWHKEAIWGADARYGAGYAAWQKAFKGVG
jgi:phage major head subunit gpT-like protein